MKNLPIETKLFSAILILLFAIIGFSCSKKETAKKSEKTTGFTSISELKNNSVIKKAIEASGITIYDGSYPPTIEGEYSTEQVRINDASSNYSAFVGKNLSSIFKFENQSSGTITSYERAINNSSVYSNGKGAFISGSGSYFTLWIEDDNSDGSTSVLVLSGELLDNGDIDMQGFTVITDNPPSHAIVGDWWAYSGTMKVLNKNITITSPSTGDILYRGQTYAVNWTGYSNEVKVYLKHYYNTSSYVKYLVTTTTDNSCTFTIPYTTRSFHDYSIYIVSTDGSYISSETGYFKIIPDFSNASGKLTISNSSSGDNGTYSLKKMIFENDNYVWPNEQQLSFYTTTGVTNSGDNGIIEFRLKNLQLDSYNNLNNGTYSSFDDAVVWDNNLLGIKFHSYMNSVSAIYGSFTISGSNNSYSISGSFSGDDGATYKITYNGPGDYYIGDKE